MKQANKKRKLLCNFKTILKPKLILLCQILIFLSYSIKAQLFDSKTYVPNIDQYEWQQDVAPISVDGELIQLSMVSFGNDLKRSQIRKLDPQGNVVFNTTLGDVYNTNNGIMPTCKPVRVLYLPNQNNILVLSYVLNPNVMSTPQPSYTFPTPKWEIRLTLLDQQGNIIRDEIKSDADHNMLPTCMDYDSNLD